MDYQNNIDENDLIKLYEWLDTFQFSRPKKSISRDFSDGGKISLRIVLVLMAELLKTIFPKFVEVHNYPAANATKHKRKNWITLNGSRLFHLKLFRKSI